MACHNARMNAPDTERSLPDLAAVRAAIDGLDAKLVELLCEREALVRRAAELKFTAAEVAAPDRALLVIRRAAEAAAARGADPAVAEAVFTAMVQSFVALELRAHAGES